MTGRGVERSVVVGNPAPAGSIAAPSAVGSQPHRPERLGHRPPEGGAAGRERPGQLDGADGPDRPGEVGRTEAHHAPVGGEHEQLGLVAPAPRALQHDGLVAPPGDDVARFQRFEPAGSAAAPAGGAALGPVAEQRPVLLHVAPLALHRLPVAGQQLPAPFEVPLEADDLLVGAVLGKRQVEEMVGDVGRVPPHEVGGHVVGRSERRLEGVGPGRGQRRHLVEGDVRVP